MSMARRAAVRTLGASRLASGGLWRRVPRGRPWRRRFRLPAHRRDLDYGIGHISGPCCGVMWEDRR